MEWHVSFDPAFAAEAKQFARLVQLEIAALAGLLRQFRPQLWQPLRHARSAETREHEGVALHLAGWAWRIAFAFHPERNAILLVGGSKSGVNERLFYRDLTRVADERFSAPLITLPPRAGGKK